MTPSPDQPQHAEGAGGANVIEVPASEFKTRYRYVELIAVPEDDGDGYSGYVPSLPGVRSQGDDPVETFATLEEALRAAIESYASDDTEVPWRDEPPPETNRRHRSKWIQVDG